MSNDMMGGDMVLPNSGGREIGLPRSQNTKKVSNRLLFILATSLTVLITLGVVQHFVLRNVVIKPAYDLFFLIGRQIDIFGIVVVLFYLCHLVYISSHSQRILIPSFKVLFKCFLMVTAVCMLFIFGYNDIQYVKGNFVIVKDIVYPNGLTISSLSPEPVYSLFLYTLSFSILNSVCTYQTAFALTGTFNVLIALIIMYFATPSFTPVFSFFKHLKKNYLAFEFPNFSFSISDWVKDFSVKNDTKPVANLPLNANENIQTPVKVSQKVNDNVQQFSVKKELETPVNLVKKEMPVISVPPQSCAIDTDYGIENIPVHHVKVASRAGDKIIADSFENDSHAVSNFDESSVAISAQYGSEEFFNSVFVSLGLDCEFSKQVVGHRALRIYFRKGGSCSEHDIRKKLPDLRMPLRTHYITLGSNIDAQEYYLDIDRVASERETVQWSDVIKSPEFQNLQVGVALGFDIDRKPVCYDFKQLQHTLIAGRTDSGKSNVLHLILCSLIVKNQANGLVRIHLLDHHNVVAMHYTGLNCFSTLTTDSRKAIPLLNKMRAIFNKRVQLFAQHKCTDIIEWNKRFPNNPMPIHFCMIEECVDLIELQDKNQQEPFKKALNGIAVSGRKAGIFLFLSAQYPAKMNIGGVSSQFRTIISGVLKNSTESNTIFQNSQESPAHLLQTHGDFIVCKDGKTTRVAMAYLGNQQIEKIISFVKNNQGVTVN